MPAPASALSPFGAQLQGGSNRLVVRLTGPMEGEQGQRRADEQDEEGNRRTPTSQARRKQLHGDI